MVSAYTAYRPSGVDWLGDVSQNWEVKRMKYIPSINDETLSESTDPTYEFNYVYICNVSHPQAPITTTIAIAATGIVAGEVDLIVSG